MILFSSLRNKNIIKEYLAQLTLPHHIKCERQVTQKFRKLSKHTTFIQLTIRKVYSKQKFKYARN